MISFLLFSQISFQLFLYCWAVVILTTIKRTGLFYYSHSLNSLSQGRRGGCLSLTVYAAGDLTSQPHDRSKQTNINESPYQHEQCQKAKVAGGKKRAATHSEVSEAQQRFCSALIARWMIWKKIVDKKSSFLSISGISYAMSNPKSSLEDRLLPSSRARQMLPLQPFPSCPFPMSIRQKQPSIIYHFIPFPFPQTKKSTVLTARVSLHHHPASPA
jgi:hypothetical protein